VSSCFGCCQLACNDGTFWSHIGDIQWSHVGFTQLGHTTVIHTIQVETDEYINDAMESYDIDDDYS
jgi:hypothetical protein